jgi:hypothetical protein
MQVDVDTGRYCGHMSGVPGWYPDPWQPTQWRWFDGLQWSGYVHQVANVPSLTEPNVTEAHLTEADVIVAATASPSNPSAWWWAGGTLVAVFAVSILGAWLLNR